ncbi:MAG: hypothetical protein NTV32_08560 [Gammaproteobacteria bacterium]|nr:hypothetical protein [Gammaproteobacteria bacterium]
MKLRQLTNKNDPRLSAKLPAATLEKIKAAAAKDKRPLADEVIRRIGTTFENMFEVDYEVTACDLKDRLKDVAFESKHLQRIPKEMLDALKDSADQAGHSFDMEVSLRLGATLSAPEVFSAKDLFSKLRHLRKPKALEDAEKEALAEIIGRHYELQKFKHFMQYVDRLPKVVHETFHFIDIEAEAAPIMERMIAEDEANRDPKDPVKRRDWNLIKKRIHDLSVANKQDEQADKSVDKQEEKKEEPGKSQSTEAENVRKNKKNGKSS